MVDRYAEDYYAGGDRVDAEQVDPHQLGEEPEETQQPPQIPDAWKMIGRYAEDFYAGGDRIDPDASNPHILNRNDDQHLVPAEAQMPTTEDAGVYIY